MSIYQTKETNEDKANKSISRNERSPFPWKFIVRPESLETLTLEVFWEQAQTVFLCYRKTKKFRNFFPIEGMSGGLIRRKRNAVVTLIQSFKRIKLLKNIVFQCYY